MASPLRGAIQKEFNPVHVGVIEFSESSEYCGKPLYPLQQVLLKLFFLEEMEGWEEDVLTGWIDGGRDNEVMLSPDIRQRRDICRERGYSHFTEIDLVGGRRSSKGHLTGLAGAYKLWQVRNIPNPGLFFNMDIDRQIEFSCIAASFDQAKTRQFADFYSSINRCKALQPFIAKRQEEVITVRCDSDNELIADMKRNKIKVAKDFAKLVVKPLAANADTLRGAASIFIDFDEMAFMMPGESRSSASECYIAAEPSLAQFGHHAMVFCNPPEAPLWMADLSFRPIGEVVVGDKVVGWSRPDGKVHKELCESVVTNVMRRQSSIVKVTMKSGRTFRCTPDHRWLTMASGGSKDEDGEFYAPPKVGRKLAHVVDPSIVLNEDDRLEAAWLGGLWDGEGYAARAKQLTICQSREKNPLICERIERALTRLGFEWRYHEIHNKLGDAGAYHLLTNSSRQPIVDFANWTRPSQIHKLQAKVFAGRWRTEDRIVAIEPDGEGEVVALTTSTGNYVANGYASKNCNSSPWSRIGQFFTQFELAMRKEGHIDGWYPMRMAMQFPSWAPYDQWWIDPDKKWSNAIMVSPNWPDQLDPDVPESKLDAKNISMRESEILKERANPDTYKVEYRSQWAEVLDAYLNPLSIDAAFSGVKPDGTACRKTNGGGYMFDYMAHVDPSSTTAGFGFALAHVEEFPDPTDTFPDGVARHVVFDHVKRWNPADFNGGVINYIKVREELALYAELYRPHAITFDQYNSTGLIQELREDVRKRGIHNCNISEVTATAKVNWNRWEAFKTALYLGLVHVPPDCIDKHGFDNSDYASQELKHLQEVMTGQTKRVDKQELGPIKTKDIADCIAEVTIKFLGSYLGDIMTRNFETTQLQTGAEGGYQIGGRDQGGAMSGGKSRVGAPDGKRSGSFDVFYPGRRGVTDASRARGISGRGRR